MRGTYFGLIAIVFWMSGCTTDTPDSSVKPTRGPAPALQSIQPAVLKKDDVAILTGTFGAAGQVYIGGRSVATSGWSENEIQFVLTGDVPGGDVTVRVSSGDSASNNVTAVVVPTLTNVVIEGDRLTVTGENLCTSCPLMIGGVPAAPRSATAVSATVDIPPEAPGGDVLIAQAAGIHSSNALSAHIEPHAGSMAPASAAPGDTVTFFGDHLGAEAEIRFGEQLLSVVSASGRAVQFAVPAGAAIRATEVRVVVGDDQTEALMLAVKPVIRSVSPQYGPAGTDITLTGNFGSQMGTVSYRGVPMTVAVWSPTSIKVQLTAGMAAGAGALVVTVNGVSSAGVSFDCLPWIDSLDPLQSAPGVAMQISGRSFGAPSAGSRVWVGGIGAPISSWTDTLIGVTVPASAPPGTNTVQIQIDRLFSNTAQFEHQRPWIDIANPGVGPIGTTIHVRGRYLGAVSGTASVGGFAAVVTGWSNASFYVTVPPGIAAGSRSIQAVDADAQNLNRMPFIVRGSDTWVPFGPPRSRWAASAVWSGTEMIVWGGYRGNAISATGERYNPSTDSWLPVSQTGAPEARDYHLAVWTGDAMLVYGGQGSGYSNDLSSGGKYDPATDAWSSMAGGPAGDMNQQAFWTGSEMIVYGGVPQYGSFGPPTLALYNPVTNTWRYGTQTGIPDNSTGYTVVWSGAELIVWGGGRNIYEVRDVSGRYDPVLNQWRPLGNTGASPGLRQEHVAVWTGRRMLVWGGHDKTEDLNDGGAYDPATGRWELITSSGPLPAPHAAAQAVWDGTEMLVWGGHGNFYPQTTVGLRYDPEQKRWSSMATSPTELTYSPLLWTGKEMLVRAGDRPGYRYRPDIDLWTSMGENVVPSNIASPSPAWTGTELLMWSGEGGYGWVYHPATDQWTRMNTAGSPGARFQPTTVWTGTTLAVWGGSVNWAPQQTGLQYRPATNDWAPMSTIAAPSARYRAGGVLSGGEVVIWGGATDSGGMNDGARWHAATDTWQALPSANAPEARSAYSFLGTATMVIVWGGYNTSYQALGTGKRFVLADNAWTPVSDTAAPAARQKHEAVWTGDKMFVWGGYVNNQTANTGGLYNPVSDTWTATPVNGATPAYSGQSVIAWTGTEVFVWAAARTSLFNPATSVWRAASLENSFANAQFAIRAGNDIFVYPEGWYVP